MNTLKGETFKLWMYLDKNPEGSQFDLRQKLCEEWGIKKTAYYDAINKLIDAHYLVSTKDDENIYIF